MKKDNIATLYVIGNGFDKAHDIQSSYEAFYNYLHKGYKSFLGNLAEIYPQLFDKEELWCKFEEELSNYDIPNSIIDTSLDAMKTLESYQEDDIDYAVAEDFMNFEIDTRNKFVEILDELNDHFKSWVTDIDISKCCQKYKINKTSLYLTFNYTKTLEDAYNIEKSNICYIHGRTGDPHLIIGHCWDHGNKIFPNNELSLLESIADAPFRKKIIGRLEKKCDNIIAENQSFFDRIEEVEEVIILGHSLSKVDMPYFQEISDRIGGNSIWKVSYYSERDKDRIREFRNELRLRNCCDVPFEKLANGSIE